MEKTTTTTATTKNEEAFRRADEFSQIKFDMFHKFVLFLFLNNKKIII
jgi:hypothetical protein